MRLWTLHPRYLDAQGLVALWREASGKIGKRRFRGVIGETDGQLLYEWRHLQRKLRQRDAKRYEQCRREAVPESHPLFRIVPGAVQAWERVK